MAADGVEVVDAAAAPFFFEGIPTEATTFCPPPFSSAVLTLPTTVAEQEPQGQTSKSSIIEIGKSSQVVANRNALVVGRQAATCDIRITHKSLSRQHALFYYYFGRDEEKQQQNKEDNGQHQLRPQLYLMDLDTKSGTFVNQVRIAAKTSVALRNGDVIQFGKAPPSFTVQWDIDDDNDKNERDIPQQQQSALETPEEMTPGAEGYRDPFEGLTGRERRQAEIAAMMASLDEAPTYAKYVPSNEDQPPHGTKKKLEKHRLPLSDYTDMAILETSHISSVAMDPTGARFAIGSMDSSLKLYDFAGFNAHDPISFQNIMIEDGYPIRSMAYSSTGERLVIATGSSQPLVVDRDGQELVKFVRGDVYVTDPSKTIGHTASVTCVGWHPLEKSIVFTTSRDGSLRCWNVDKGKLSFSMLMCSDVLVIKNLKTGRKTIPTCLAVSSNTLAMGTVCGSLQIFKYPIVSKLRPRSIHARDAQRTSYMCSLLYRFDKNCHEDQNCGQCVEHCRKALVIFFAVDDM
jgi:hypothetical protein